MFLRRLIPEWARPMCRLLRLNCRMLKLRCRLLQSRCRLLKSHDEHGLVQVVWRAGSCAGYRSVGPARPPRMGKGHGELGSVKVVTHNSQALST